MSEIEYRIGTATCAGAGCHEGQLEGNIEGMKKAHHSLDIALLTNRLNRRPYFSNWDCSSFEEVIEDAIQIIRRLYGDKAKEMQYIPRGAAHGQFIFRMRVLVDGPTAEEKRKVKEKLEERFLSANEKVTGPFEV
jgi:hypothetical protein